ncbi:uncharacterized protein LOC112126206 isoform X2 [Cimex lectularius]|uniref:Transposase n=1 Tax=Cimex lectularius TaxID=79782 RepID=A0A8I6TIB7_CIMLE|nr:uncharacterized protein LOC112126206 isoform X2 [Cimex lectularius]
MMFFFYKHMLNDGDLVTVIRLLEERYSLQEVAKRLTMSVNHCTIGSVHRRFRGTGLHIRKPGQSRPWSADERDDRLIRSGESARLQWFHGHPSPPFCYPPDLCVQVKDNDHH